MTTNTDAPYQSEAWTTKVYDTAYYANRKVMPAEKARANAMYTLNWWVTKAEEDWEDACMVGGNDEELKLRHFDNVQSNRRAQIARRKSDNKRWHLQQQQRKEEARQQQLKEEAQEAQEAEEQLQQQLEEAQEQLEQRLQKRASWSILRLFAEDAVAWCCDGSYRYD